RTRFLADGILAQQVDAAGIGRVLAVEHVKAGAFSRAVRADQRQDLAGLQRERDVAHGMNAAIRLAQAFDRQQCFRRAHSAVSTPPSSAMTSASTDSAMPRLSGNTLPLR